jgi:hypothetical protein
VCLLQSDRCPSNQALKLDSIFLTPVTRQRPLLAQSADLRIGASEDKADVGKLQFVASKQTFNFDDDQDRNAAKPDVRRTVPSSVANTDCSATHLLYVFSSFPINQGNPHNHFSLVPLKMKCRRLSNIH